MGLPSANSVARDGPLANRPYDGNGVVDISDVDDEDAAAAAATLVKDLVRVGSVGEKPGGADDDDDDCDDNDAIVDGAMEETAGPSAGDADGDGKGETSESTAVIPE